MGIGVINANSPGLQATPADPSGTSSTTGVMAGLGVSAGTITPTYTGRILAIISGNITNTTATAGNGGKVQLRYGTGSAPVSGAALTGTTIGNIVTSVLERATSDLQCFSVQAFVSGLTIGTAYWFDLSQAAITAGSINVRNVSVTLLEF